MYKDRGKCKQCGLLTVDTWVHRLNQLAQYMAEWEQAMHPSAWHEFFQDEREAYTKLAQSPTCTCDMQPVQFTLMESEGA